VGGMSAAESKADNPSGNATESRPADDGQPMIDLQVGKIVLYPNRMGMTGSESLMECLQSLPALVQKGSVDLLSNFTLAEDGNTYLADPTIYLEQTQINEIERIEIQTDGSVSDGLSGIIGVINVVTKSAAEGTHGHIDLMANTNGEVYPSVYSSYRKGYFSAVGSVMGLSDRTKTDTFKSSGTDSSNEYNKQRSNAEAVKVRLKWELPHDMFQFKVSQLYGNDRTRDTLRATSGDIQSLQRTSSQLKTNKINCNFEYNHTFNYGGVLKLSAGVEHINKTDNSDSFANQLDEDGLCTSDYLLTMLDDSYSGTTTWSASLKYITPISSWGGLTLALPMSRNSVDQDIYRLNGDSNQADQLKKVEQEYATNTYNPYFIFNAQLSKQWGLKIGQRLTFARYSMNDYSNAAWSDHRSSWFMTAGLLYQPTPEHNLQLNFRRTASMPSVLQLFPYRWFYQSPNIYYTGNPELRPSTFEVYNLNYSFCHRNLQLSSSLQYYVNHNGIETIKVSNGEAGEGMPWYGWTSYNIGKLRAFDANVSAVYSVGNFQAMAGANVYHQVNSANEHITWCCLRISPTVKFPHQWTASAQISYVSPQVSELQTIGKSYYGLLRLSKSWSFGLSLFAYWENFLTTDSLITISGADTSTTRIRYHENKLSIGLSYAFL
jgi:hypothetical protein